MPRLITMTGRSRGVSLILIAVTLVALAAALGPFGTERAKGQDSGSAASVAVWPGVGELHSKSSFAIMGSGYEPGSEIHIVMQTEVGRGTFSGTVQQDITSNVIPAVEATDEAGNFAARFDMGRFERVVSENVIGISVTDADYNVLATTSVVFCDPQGRSRVGVYNRKAPDYVKNPDDPRPASFCSGFFDYPERPSS